MTLNRETDQLSTLSRQECDISKRKKEKELRALQGKIEKFLDLPVRELKKRTGEEATVGGFMVKKELTSENIVKQVVSPLLAVPIGNFDYHFYFVDFCSNGRGDCFRLNPACLKRGRLLQRGFSVYWIKSAENLNCCEGQDVKVRNGELIGKTDYPGFLILEGLSELLQRPDGLEIGRAILNGLNNNKKLAE